MAQTSNLELFRQLIESGGVTSPQYAQKYVNQIEKQMIETLRSLANENGQEMSRHSAVMSLLKEKYDDQLKKQDEANANIKSSLDRLRKRKVEEFYQLESTFDAEYARLFNQSHQNDPFVVNESGIQSESNFIINQSEDLNEAQIMPEVSGLSNPEYQQPDKKVKQKDIFIQQRNTDFIIPQQQNHKEQQMFPSLQMKAEEFKHQRQENKVKIESKANNQKLEQFSQAPPHRPSQKSKSPKPSQNPPSPKPSQQPPLPPPPKLSQIQQPKQQSAQAINNKPKQPVLPFISDLSQPCFRLGNQQFSELDIILKNFLVPKKVDHVIVDEQSLAKINMREENKIINISQSFSNDKVVEQFGDNNLSNRVPPKEMISAKPKVKNNFMDIANNYHHHSKSDIETKASTGLDKSQVEASQFVRAVNQPPLQPLAKVSSQSNPFNKANNPIKNDPIPNNSVNKHNPFIQNGGQVGPSIEVQVKQHQMQQHIQQVPKLLEQYSPEVKQEKGQKFFEENFIQTLKDNDNEEEEVKEVLQIMPKDKQVEIYDSEEDVLQINESRYSNNYNEGMNDSQSFYDQREVQKVETKQVQKKVIQRKYEESEEESEEEDEEVEEEHLLIENFDLKESKQLLGGRTDSKTRSKLLQILEEYAGDTFKYFKVSTRVHIGLTLNIKSESKYLLIKEQENLNIKGNIISKQEGLTIMRNIFDDANFDSSMLRFREEAE